MKFKHTRMPLLRDVLNEVPGGSRVLVELKFTDATCISDLLHLLSEYSSLNLSVLTFKREFAGVWVGLTKQIPVLLNAKVASEVELRSHVAHSMGSGYAGLSLKWLPWFNSSVFRFIQDAGLMSAVWTVNSLTDAKRAKELGVDLLMTDWPQKMSVLKSDE